MHAHIHTERQTEALAYGRLPPLVHSADARTRAQVRTQYMGGEEERDLSLALAAVDPDDVRGRNS